MPLVPHGVCRRWNALSVGMRYMLAMEVLSRADGGTFR